MKAHFYNIDQVSCSFSSQELTVIVIDLCVQVNNLREIQALKRLSPHPNIITLHEVL